MRILIFITIIVLIGGVPLYVLLKYFEALMPWHYFMALRMVHFVLSFLITIKVADELFGEQREMDEQIERFLK